MSSLFFVFNLVSAAASAPAQTQPLLSPVSCLLPMAFCQKPADCGAITGATLPLGHRTGALHLLQTFLSTAAADRNPSLTPPVFDGSSESFTGTITGATDRLSPEIPIRLDKARPDWTSSHQTPKSPSYGDEPSRRRAATRILVILEDLGFLGRRCDLAPASLTVILNGPRISLVPRVWTDMQLGHNLFMKFLMKFSWLFSSANLEGETGSAFLVPEEKMKEEPGTPKRALAEE